MVHYVFQVGKYTSPMDGMGKETHLFFAALAPPRNSEGFRSEESSVFQVHSYS